MRRYIDSLVTEAVADARAIIRARFARAAPAVAEVVATLAEGKGRPEHPYLDKYTSQVLDRILGRPHQGAQVEVGAEIPTDHGPVRIIFKAEA